MSKPIIQSKTTWTIAGASAVGAGAVYTVLAVIRSVWPDLLPWSEETDRAIDHVILVAVIPLVSRVIYLLRGKATTAGVVLLATGLGVLNAGCVTTHEGTSWYHRVDWDQVKGVSEAAAPLVREGISIGMDWYAEHKAVEESKQVAKEERTALLIGALAFARTYSQSQDYEAALRDANDTVALLGVDKTVIELAMQMVQPNGDYPDNLDLLVQVLREHGKLPQ